MMIILPICLWAAILTIGYGGKYDQDDMVTDSQEKVAGPSNSRRELRCKPKKNKNCGDGDGGDQQQQQQQPAYNGPPFGLQPKNAFTQPAQIGYTVCRADAITQCYEVVAASPAGALQPSVALLLLIWTLITGLWGLPRQLPAGTSSSRMTKGATVQNFHLRDQHQAMLQNLFERVAESNNGMVPVEPLSKALLEITHAKADKIKTLISQYQDSSKSGNVHPANCIAIIVSAMSDPAVVKKLPKAEVDGKRKYFKVKTLMSSLNKEYACMIKKIDSNEDGIITGEDVEQILGTLEVCKKEQ